MTAFIIVTILTVMLTGCLTFTIETDIRMGDYQPFETSTEWTEQP